MVCCRLSLDKNDIQAWGSHSKDDVLRQACFSAAWSNNDAIDAAVTTALGGDRKVLATSTNQCTTVCSLCQSADLFQHACIVCPAAQSTVCSEAAQSGICTAACALADTSALLEICNHCMTHATSVAVLKNKLK